MRKPPIWNLQPGLVAPAWRAHWRGAKAVFPLFEATGASVHAVPLSTRWQLANGAVTRVTRHGPAVHFPGSDGNEVGTTGDPITFASGEPYTLALLIHLAGVSGNQGIFRAGAASNGGWLWMLSSGRLWGRHDGINSPSAASGPLITAGWHSFVRVWDGREVRQYVDGVRFTTTPVTATGSWTIHRLGWQIFTHEALDQADLPFFGAFGTAWNDAMVRRWSAEPLAMLWPEPDAAIITGSAGGGPVPQRRPVMIVAAG
jgi:hypothetical protein